MGESLLFWESFILTNLSLALCAEKNSSEAERKEQKRWRRTCYLSEVGGWNFPRGIETFHWVIIVVCVFRGQTGANTSFFLSLVRGLSLSQFELNNQLSRRSVVFNLSMMYYVYTCEWDDLYSILFIMCNCLSCIRKKKVAKDNLPSRNFCCFSVLSWTLLCIVSSNNDFSPPVSLVYRNLMLSSYVTCGN
jgi:hypothetical protein